MSTLAIKDLEADIDMRTVVGGTSLQYQGPTTYSKTGWALYEKQKEDQKVILPTYFRL